jgi:hypothetical protein
MFGYNDDEVRKQKQDRALEEKVEELETKLLTSWTV